jgi:ribosome biogenesis protein MAK21
LALGKEEVPIEEQFFHRYFTTKAENAKKAKAAASPGTDADEDGVRTIDDDGGGLADAMDAVDFAGDLGAKFDDTELADGFDLEGGGLDDAFDAADMGGFEGSDDDDDDAFGDIGFDGDEGSDDEMEKSGGTASVFASAEEFAQMIEDGENEKSGEALERARDLGEGSGKSGGNGSGGKNGMRKMLSAKPGGRRTFSKKRGKRG